MISEQQRHRMIESFVKHHGEEVAMSLAESLPTSDVATKRDLERFATKEDLKAFATKKDLEAFATKEDLKAFATKDDLKAFATKKDLEAFATRDDLHKAIISQTRWLIGVMLLMVGLAVTLG